MMENQIPIHFDYNGQHYSGHFKPITGSGATQLWHLMINKYYIGQLVHSNEWRFYGTKFNEMGEKFGEYMVAWYQ